MVFHIDHIVYPLSAQVFDKVVAQFARAGFTAHSRQVRHGDGRVSAFFRLCGGYLEFCMDTDHDQARAQCSIWLCAQDLAAALKQLSPAWRAGVTLTAQAPLGEQTPAWLLTELPAADVGAARLSLIQYLRGTGTDLTLAVPDNGLFAISAISLLCHHPERDRHHYQEGLAVAEITAGCLPIGEQWLGFRERNQQDAGIHFDTVKCVVHLVTAEPDQSAARLEAAGFVVSHVATLGLVAQSVLEPSICLVLETALASTVRECHEQSHRAV
ncbi:hypothetical protein [Pseudomonas putida]